MSRKHGEPICDGIVGHLVTSMKIDMHTTSSTSDSMFVVW